jgi:hypothetical protein
MASPEERTEMVEKIKKLPELLHAAVNGLDDSQLDTPYRNGEWTVRQVVHHLADSHMNAFARMKLLVTEDNPTIKPYDQDKWAALPDARFLQLESSLSIIDGLHHRMVHLLSTLSDAQWLRKGRHPESGEISMDSLLKTYSKHGENHVKQITDLRQNMGW